MKTPITLLLICAAITAQADPLNTLGRSSTSGTADYAKAILDGTSIYHAGDFATAAQGALAASAIQTGASQVTGLTITANGNTLTLTGTSIPYATQAGSLVNGGNIVSHNVAEFATAAQGALAASAIQTGASQVTGLTIAANGNTLTLTGTSIPYATQAGSLVNGGNIVTHNVAEFATAAQGALAAAALPATGGAATNITINGLTLVSGTISGNVVRTGMTTGGTYAIGTFSGSIFADNTTFNGANNTAPNQVGQTPASSTLLVKAQADALYASEYWLQLSSDLSATSHTVVSSTDSITLPAGSYSFQGFVMGNTASTTGGIDVGTTTTVGGNCSVYETKFMISAQVSSFAAAPTSNGVDWTWLNSSFSNAFPANADAPSKTAAARSMGVVTFSSQTVICFTVDQRTATDAANPAILKAGSWIVFRMKKP